MSRVSSGSRRRGELKPTPRLTCCTDGKVAGIDHRSVGTADHYNFVSMTIPERLSLFSFFVLLLLGSSVWGDSFRLEALASGVVFLAGIPLAFALLRHEQVAQRIEERRGRESELLALSRAGHREADRIRKMAQGLVDWLDGGERAIGPYVPIVAVWSETLGSRFFQLTADDGPIHDLRQAHSALAVAVRSLEVAESPSPPGDPERLKGESRLAASSSITWATRAGQAFESAKLGW